MSRAWLIEQEPLVQQLRAENERLLTVIRRIDAINDNPYHFNKEINDECNKVLRPELTQG